MVWVFVWSLGFLSGGREGLGFQGFYGRGRLGLGFSDLAQGSVDFGSFGVHLWQRWRLYRLPEAF